ncbi:MULTISPECIES: ATP-binding protein [Ramlibacter]|uniref:histidine kinase n=1 Tax=Ramlibacter pinisoli TaxID=2682844 RepID=A0A6N8IQW2_9BURK|nr:HAMP domain-containing histidine kinase [Ramlibacter sp. CGMCC 1.13660]MVQ29237.1 sensor histidine kinase [Ramlibacter pinisoli]
MRPSNSIGHRLSRVVLLVSLAWSLAVFGVVWGVVRWQIDSVLDDALQESAEILYGLLRANEDRFANGTGGSLQAPPHDERLVWQLVDAQGRVAWRSHRAPPQALAPAGSGHWTDPGPLWHVYRIPFGKAGPIVMVAQPQEARRQIKFEAGLVTAASALLVGLACAILLRRRVRAELQPLVQLSRDVAAYQPLADAGALPAASRQELVPLRNAIVGLGERLARMVASERAFSAHAAHALRTPLAGLGAQLALAQRDSEPAAAARIGRAREAADRLARVVSALLTLFRSGTEPALQPIDLGALLHDLPVAGLAVEVRGVCVARADPDLLAAALLNLLDNSVRHGATAVTATLFRDRGRALLRLVDDGPGVDEATRGRLETALRSQDFSQGLGLGLMLASRVVAAHGGSLVLLPPAGPGFGIELSLPAA